jgi:hypothetical protein
MKQRYLLGVASAFALMLPVAAEATPVALSAPTFQTSYTLHAFDDNFVSSGTGPLSLHHTVTSSSSVNAGSASANLDVAVTPFPTINISTSASGVGSAAVSENMTYLFSLEDASGVFDPGNPVTAKTIVSYKGAVSAPSDGFASSSFSIAGQNFSESYKVVTGESPSAIHTIGNGFPDPAFFGSTSFDETKTYDMLVNAVYRIDIGASAGNTFSGSSMAYLDPFFQLDPSELGKGYKLVFSPGISNIPSVAATPLPSSLVIFGTALLGLVGFGFTAQRKSAVVALPAWA